jgi:hypothetical protein
MVQAVITNLEKLGGFVEAALRKAIEDNYSPEIRKLTETLLNKLEQGRNPRLLQMLRAIAALEQIGSPEAQEVSRTVAKDFVMPRGARRRQGRR